MSLKPRKIVLIPGFMLDEMLWHEFERYLPGKTAVRGSSRCVTTMVRLRMMALVRALNKMTKAGMPESVRIALKTQPLRGDLPEI
jgi:hypothetical protein